MEAASTRHAASTSHEVMPACPDCRTEMVVRAQWTGGTVTGLYWGCRRAPGCEGVRKIKSPDLVRPISYDASAQAIFDWESSREGRLSHRQVAAAPPPPATGLRRIFGRLARTEEIEEPEWTPDNASVGHFDSLVEFGFVVLENRLLPAARARVDNLVIGPSGVFVVQRKAWTGQVVTTTDSVFVDGRERVGAIDEVNHAALKLDETLDYELKPLGVGVKPALLFEGATNKQFVGTIGKVTVGGTRGLPKLIRGRGEPVLGPETIVRLAVAADRLLE
jgi:Nuclease-related domain